MNSCRLIWRFLQRRAFYTIVLPAFNFFALFRPICYDAPRPSSGRSFLKLLPITGRSTLASMYILYLPEHPFQLREVALYKEYSSGQVFFVGKVVDSRGRDVGYVSAERCTESMPQQWYMNEPGDFLSVQISRRTLLGNYHARARKSRTYKLSDAERPDSFLHLVNACRLSDQKYNHLPEQSFWYAGFLFALLCDAPTEDVRMRKHAFLATTAQNWGIPETTITDIQNSANDASGIAAQLKADAVRLWHIRNMTEEEYQEEMKNLDEEITQKYRAATKELEEAGGKYRAEIEEHKERVRKYGAEAEEHKERARKYGAEAEEHMERARKYRAEAEELKERARNDEADRH
ncbi:hypothetical protein BKA93DRAFT_823228 [Sparassis latifolia]